MRELDRRDLNLLRRHRSNGGKDQHDEEETAGHGTGSDAYAQKKLWEPNAGSRSKDAFRSEMSGEDLGCAAVAAGNKPISLPVVHVCGDSSSFSFLFIPLIRQMLAN
jgi:hypothetical protein